MDLFWERGYERTSTQDLADAMGIGKQSLYNAFGSKRELYLRALAEYHRKVEERMLPAVSGAGTALQKVRAAFDAALELGRGKGCMIVNALAEAAPADDDVRGLAGGWLVETEEEFARIVEQGQAAGDIPAGKDARAEARALGNALVGLRIQMRAGRPEAELSQLEDRIIAGLAAA